MEIGKWKLESRKQKSRKTGAKQIEEKSKPPHARPAYGHPRKNPLGKAAPGWWRVVVRLEIRAKAVGAFRGWGEHVARGGYVFLAHQNFKACAGPREVFAHAARGVRRKHCWNAGIFERALGQISLGAATVGLDDDKLTVLHGPIISPDEREWFLPRPLG